MSVTGSFGRYLKNRGDNIDALVKETTKDGLDAMHDSITKKTPFKTGDLSKSIKKSRAKRMGTNAYHGDVSTDLYYAKFVEYGTSPHTITPNKKAALSFTGVVSKEVEHPGAKPAHMFQIGVAEFRDVKLKGIMEKNLAIYLAAGSAGLRIT